jgi:hypothetical protein
VQRIVRLFPDRFSVVHLPNSRRPLLRLDSGLMISVLICNRKIGGHRRDWVSYPVAREKDYVTLMAFANRDATGFCRYYLIPRLSSKGARVFPRADNERVLKTGFRFNKLVEFLHAAEVFSGHR